MEDIAILPHCPKLRHAHLTQDSILAAIRQAIHEISRPLDTSNLKVTREKNMSPLRLNAVKSVTANDVIGQEKFNGKFSKQ